MKIKRVRKIVKPAPWDFRITLTREEAEGLRFFTTGYSSQRDLNEALRRALDKAI